MRRWEIAELVGVRHRPLEHMISLRWNIFPGVSTVYDTVAYLATLRTEKLQGLYYALEIDCLEQIEEALGKRIQIFVSVNDQYGTTVLAYRRHNGNELESFKLTFRGKLPEGACLQVMYRNADGSYTMYFNNGEGEIVSKEAQLKYEGENKR